MNQFTMFGAWGAIAAMCMWCAPGAAAADEALRNNLVTELLDVASVQDEAYAFRNPRDGWVFVSVIPGTGKTTVSLVPSLAQDAKGEARVLRGIETGAALEIMQQLPAGAYRLHVRGGDSSRLVVRAIPELIYTGLGYPCPTRADGSSPWLESLGPYDWRFLQRNRMLENFNVILERGDPRPENVSHLEDWRDQGKKVLTSSFVDGLRSRVESFTVDAVFKEWSKRGFGTDGIDGTLMSEFSPGYFSADEYAVLTEVVKRLGDDPKFKDQVFYPYVYGDMVRYEESRAFLKAILDAGYRWAEEHYLEEQPTETEAIGHIDGTIRRDHLNYAKAFPDCARQVIVNIGHFSIPQLTLDVDPGVDYKVFLDMQMHLVANDPVFRGIYGVSWYHPAYADEEMMRWSAKLNRHYCIEGRTDRLTSDPYELPHLKNPDFDDRLAGWTLEPAEEGSIAVGKAEQFGQLQGRFTGDKGNRFLVIRRSATAPNRVSQGVVGLTPGRL